ASAMRVNADRTNTTEPPIDGRGIECRARRWRRPDTAWATPGTLRKSVPFHNLTESPDAAYIAVARPACQVMDVARGRTFVSVRQYSPERSWESCRPCVCPHSLPLRRSPARFWLQAARARTAEAQWPRAAGP